MLKMVMMHRCTSGPLASAANLINEQHLLELKSIEDSRREAEGQGSRRRVNERPQRIRQPTEIYDAGPAPSPSVAKNLAAGISKAAVRKSARHHQ